MTRYEFANGRWYMTGDGTWVPSVTTILNCYPKGRGFERWLGEAKSYDDAIAARDSAGERGSFVHEVIADLLKGNKVVIPADADSKATKQIQGFCNWWEDNRPEAIAVEEFLVGEDYAGTVDFICRIKNSIWLIDFKTSTNVYVSHHLQTAAYSKAAVYQDIVPYVDCRGILHLKSNTKKGYQLVEPDTTEKEDYEVFRACKTIYHREHGYEPVPFQENDKTDKTFKLELED